MDRERTERRRVNRGQDNEDQCRKILNICEHICFQGNIKSISSDIAMLKDSETWEITKCCQQPPVMLVLHLTFESVLD